jgi:hypothetical protein
VRECESALGDSIQEMETGFADRGQGVLKCGQLTSVHVLI